MPTAPELSIEDVRRDERLRRVREGIDVEHAVQHDPVLRSVRKRAEREAVAAFHDFLSCSPHDIEAIKSIQWRAQIPLMIYHWLKEAIDAGRSAERELRYADEAGGDEASDFGEALLDELKEPLT